MVLKITVVAHLSKNVNKRSMRFFKLKKSILTAIIFTCMLCACAKEEKTVVDDVSAEEGSIATTEEAAAEESSVTPNTSYKYIADYKSYDELIEDIKNLLDIYDSSDSDTFWDEAMQYEWFTYLVYYNFIKRTDQLGYLQVDIDGDGVDEFLLGTTGSEDDSYDGNIVSMFTIKNGIVYTVFECGERDFYEIYENSIIGHGFAYPNSEYGYEGSKYEAGCLELIEEVFKEAVIEEHRDRYYSTEYASQEDTTRELTEEEYDKAMDELEHKYNIQKFQLHLFKENRKRSDDQLNEPIREIEPIANNPYFFKDIEKEYIYSVKLFFSEDIKEVPVKVAYIKSFESGDVYSLSIQHEDCTERYYYDVLDRFDIGTFYVTNDSIYLLLQCEDIPDEETFISEGMLVCSETDMDENNDGLRQKIENNGDNCCFSYDNTLIESGFYSTYKWTKEKGLTYFRSGYGAEGSPIEIMLDE